jgi:hypothetical protein
VGSREAQKVAAVPRFHELAAAGALQAYLRFVARHSSYVAIDQRGASLDLTTLVERLAQYGPRLVATYWIDNALPFATLSFAHPGLAAFARGFRFLIDDTYGGRLSAHALASVGGRYAMLARPGDALRMKQISAVIAERACCIFPVDGGGPYRQAGTGIIGLATALKAAILPVAVRASRSFAFPHRSRIHIPIAGGRVAVGLGDAITVQKSDLRVEVAARLKSALDNLEATTRAIAAGQCSAGPPRARVDRRTESV